MQVHEVYSELNCFECFVVLLLATFYQVLRQLQNSLLWPLKFLRSVEVCFEDIFSSLLSLLLFVNFSDVLHVDKIANLFVEEHIKYFERESLPVLRLIRIWNRVLSLINQCRLAV